MKGGIENSLAPHPGFEPLPSAQQAGALPLDHSAASTKLLEAIKDIHLGVPLKCKVNRSDTNAIFDDGLIFIFIPS